MITRICKYFTFEAAHQLPHHNGQCARPHGHSYKLEVEISGEPHELDGSSSEGMVYDFHDLSHIVKTAVIQNFDHYNLNELGLKGVGEVTTAERLVAWIWQAVNTFLPPRVQLERVRLYETATGYAEIRREDQSLLTLDRLAESAWGRGVDYSVRPGGN